MRVKKFFSAIFLSLFTLSLLFTGCSAPTNPPIQTSPPNQIVPSDNQDTMQLETFASLMGQSDKNLVLKLGEGEVTARGADDAVLTRDYNLTLFGTEVLASASLDEFGNLYMLTLFLPESENMETWSNHLINIFGQPTKEYEDKEEEGNKRREIIWKNGEVTISIKDIYGDLSIEFYR